MKNAFYHLCTNIWKHIQQYRLQAQYNANDDFAVYLCMFCGLALLPPEEVISQENKSVMLDYFEGTNNGTFGHNASRRNPILFIGL